MTDSERLKIIEERNKILPSLMDDLGDGEANLQTIFNDINWLIKQADQGQKSEILIRRLYNHLGSSAELDFKLWKETEAYVKALAGETNG